MRAPNVSVLDPIFDRQTLARVFDEGRTLYVSGTGPILVRDASMALDVRSAPGPKPGGPICSRTA